MQASHTKLVISTLQKSFSVCIFAFGTFILGTSLLAANKVSVGDTNRLLGQKMYIGRTILPDNILYPLVMIGDRLRLETASPENQILLRLEYADRRYTYATELLEKNQSTLALTTISKSQKYLFAVSNDVLAEPAAVDPELLLFIRNAVDHSIYRLEQLESQFTGDETVILTELLEESKVILQKLNSATEHI